MKKLFIVFFLSFAITTFTSAQDYQKFKVGFSSCLTLTEKEGIVADGSILLAIEPACEAEFLQ